MEMTKNKALNTDKHSILRKKVKIPEQDIPKYQNNYIIIKNKE